jgi:hypothetical protein
MKPPANSQTRTTVRECYLVKEEKEELTHNAKAKEKLVAFKSHTRDDGVIRSLGRRDAIGMPFLKDEA